jgi:hypothetical protein
MEEMPEEMKRKRRRRKRKRKRKGGGEGGGKHDDIRDEHPVKGLDGPTGKMEGIE